MIGRSCGGSARRCGRLVVLLSGAWGSAVALDRVLCEFGQGCDDLGFFVGEVVRFPVASILALSAPERRHGMMPLCVPSRSFLAKASPMSFAIGG
jgi:hypothetical protein